MSRLKRHLVRLAYQNPHLRRAILSALRDWKSGDVAEHGSNVVRVMEIYPEEDSALVWIGGLNQKGIVVPLHELQTTNKPGPNAPIFLSRPDLRMEYLKRANDMREALAALEHDQWAHWTQYMLDNLTEDNIARWRRQCETPYNELTEKEKDSDREWADKVLATFSD